MRKIFILFLVAVFTACCVGMSGCKGRKEKPLAAKETVDMGQEGLAPAEEETGQATAQESTSTTVVETIPPTASAPSLQEQSKAKALTEGVTREKEIQIALKNAGFYAGEIDGKIGPKTKKAIEEFQKAKGLNVDGKVGPRTWAELEKFLASGQ